MKKAKTVQLPQGIINKIIDVCARVDVATGASSRNNTLKACSLVSRAWAIHARFHLFIVVRLTARNHHRFVSSLKDAYLLLQRRASGAVLRQLPPFTTFLRVLIMDEGEEYGDAWLMTKHCPLKEIDRLLQMVQVRLEVLRFVHLAIFDAESHGMQDRGRSPEALRGLSSRGFLQFFGTELLPEDCATPSTEWSAASYVQGRALRSAKMLSISFPIVSAFEDFQTLACAFPDLKRFDLEVAPNFSYLAHVANVLGNSTTCRSFADTARWTGRALLPRSVEFIRIIMIQEEVLLEWVLRHFPKAAKMKRNRRHFVTLKNFQVATLGHSPAPLLRRVKDQYGSELNFINVEDAESDMKMLAALLSLLDAS